MAVSAMTQVRSSPARAGRPCHNLSCEGGCMPAPSTRDITDLLLAWSEGDPSALERLTPLVYEELHRLAHRYLNREYSDNSLQTSALVNEAYVRLIDWKNARWQNRAHFFGVAARLMRRILVDFARTRRAARRGGGVRRV